MGTSKLSKKAKAHLANTEELARIAMAGANGEACSPDEAESVKAMLIAMPDQFRTFGELASEALNRVVNCATTWEVERVHVRERMNKLQADLGYESSNILEQMAITQVVLNWTRLYFLESSLSRATNGNHNRESAHYWDRRVTMAQGRYNQALTTLAKLRKLKLPDITAIQAQVAYVNASDGPVDMRAKQLLPAGNNNE